MQERWANVLLQKLSVQEMHPNEFRELFESRSVSGKRISYKISHEFIQRTIKRVDHSPREL